MKVIYIFLLLLFVQGNILAEDKTVILSPHKKYECRINARDQSGIGAIIVFRDVKSNKEVKLLDTDRWAKVVWSPCDNWFAVVDHMDGQASSLAIYEVLSDPWDNFVKLERQYISPGWGVIGVDWSIYCWNLSEGTVRIKRTKVAKEETEPHKHKSIEIYAVPVE